MVECGKSKECWLGISYNECQDRERKHLANDFIMLIEKRKVLYNHLDIMIFSRKLHFTFYFYILKAKLVLKTQYSACWWNIKMNFPGMVGSKQYPNLNLSSVAYKSEKPTWTEADIDHDRSTHRKYVWGQEKKDASEGPPIPTIPG